VRPNADDDDDEPIRPVSFAAPDISEDDIQAVAEVLRSGWITTGTQCIELEAQLAEYLGIAHVVTMSSCTAALETAVAFLDLPPGAKVGVPTWTFVASAISAVRNGLQPVLLDIDPNTLNLDAVALERALDDGLDAVIGVHFGGVAMDKSIHLLCESYGVALVEDAAHALGASDHRGIVAGRDTVGACFSFYATKNLTSGEGGALSTDNEELANFARVYRNHGLSHDAWARHDSNYPKGYDLLAAGIKGNLSDLLAALARSQLARFADLQDERRTLVDRYRDNLAGTAVDFVPGEADPGAANHLMVVLLPSGVERAAVMASMLERGVSTSVHFQPLHTFPWFERHALLGPGGVPHADGLAPRAMSLPLHTCLDLADVDHVCEALTDAMAAMPGGAA